MSAPKVPATIALEAVVPKVSLATEAVVAATKVVAVEVATKAAAEASETEVATEAATKVAAEAATKEAVAEASETVAATKVAAVVADVVTVAATKAAAVAADSATVAATKAVQDHAIKVRTVAVLRATVPVEVHGPSVKNRPIGLKAAAVKTAQVPSTAVPAIPSVVLRASHA